MEEPKNRCPFCGGRLVIEFFGSYGAIYPLKKDGTQCKNRIRRVIYEEDGDSPLVYCIDCGKAKDTETSPW